MSHHKRWDLHCLQARLKAIKKAHGLKELGKVQVGLQIGALAHGLALCICVYSIAKT